MSQQPQASDGAAQSKPGQKVVAEPQKSPQHAAAPASKKMASPPPPPTDFATEPGNNVDNEFKSPHHSLPPPGPEVVPLPASPDDLAAEPGHDVVGEPKSSQDAATSDQNLGPSSRPPLSGSHSKPEPANHNVGDKRNDPDVAAPPDPDDAALQPPAEPGNAANNPAPRGPEPQGAAAVPTPAPGLAKDLAAETYFSECVNNPQAEFCIDYPARVYHFKPQQPGRCFRCCSSSSGYSHHHHHHTADDDDNNNVVRSTKHWQSTFLWQPVLLPTTATTTTNSSGEDPQQQLLLLRRRPMTDIDKMNTAQFLWFRPSSSAKPPAPGDFSLGHDGDNNKNHPPYDNDGPALGFRPWVDILLLDTDFLETYLYQSSPADHADPLGAATFFSFLPRSARERAKIKIVALSAEPLRKATFVPDEDLRDIAVYDGDDDDDNKKRTDKMSSWDHGLNGQDADRIRRRVRRKHYESYDLRIRRRAIARLLVSIFPGLERIYLVVMASVPRISPASQKTTTPGEFSKWGRLQDAILAEHRQILRTKPPKSSYFQHNNPNALLYRRALQWNLIIPNKDDDVSPTSSSQLSTLPQVFEKDIVRAREEVLAAQEWREEKERERADPELQKMRYERHRLIPFSRAWPKRKEGEKEEVAEEEREVKAEPMIMMYFADKFQQARKAGWEPGETMDVAHLFGGASR